jgi:2-polyprenyl-3-methyl-5-hydroxy-6-metoxy-1,4-benzoquinol methylase
MRFNKAYKNYSNIAKEISNDEMYLLSGRYKFTTKKYKFICEDIATKLEINKTDDIFDIGTGDGKIIASLAQKSKSATTIDSPEIINKIPQKKKIKYLKGNISYEAIKIKKKFDKILVYSVIQYFYNLNEVNKFINLCLKLLKDKGYLLIGDIPNADMNIRYQNTKEFKRLSKIFDKKRKLNYSKLDEKFHKMSIGKTVNFTDKKLIFLLKKFNTKKFESYILPQKKELPYSVKRVDFLIKKRS